MLIARTRPEVDFASRNRPRYWWPSTQIEGDLSGRSSRRSPVTVLVPRRNPEDVATTSTSGSDLAANRGVCPPTASTRNGPSTDSRNDSAGLGEARPERAALRDRIHDRRKFERGQFGRSKPPTSHQQDDNPQGDFADGNGSFGGRGTPRAKSDGERDSSMTSRAARGSN